MKHKPLGNSGISASIVGLGAWVIGGGTVWGQDPDDRESVRTIQAALDLGVNLIDTAPASASAAVKRSWARRLRAAATRPCSPPSAACGGTTRAGRSSPSSTGGPSI